jgi:quercetin dioxygenase-like cupin family protein
MRVIRAAEGDSEERTGAAIFKGGQVWARPLAGAEPGLGKDMNISIVQFGAGARTKMHRHTGDQLLYVVSGIGKVGTGNEEHVVSVGDFILIPGGEDHWHGAADTGSPMSHITVTLQGSETSVTE